MRLAHRTSRRSVFAALITTVAIGLAVSACSVDAPPRWNVVLVTFDTTRADHLAPYGDVRADTPTLKSLAAEGVVFEQAFTAAPITAPSHSTILTGRYPIAHGFRDNGLFKLGEEETTLAEVLRENGYATAAAVASYPLLAKFGFDQGFELFDDDLTGHIEDHLGERAQPKQRLFFDERRAAQVNEAVLPWLESQATNAKPFFLWVHYFDPHQPFEPPSPFNQQYADDLYAGEISYSDRSLGRLLEHIEQLGLLENTLVVMTADHGEGLGEHGEQTHAVLAYNSTLHVPLILRPPVAGRGSVGRVAERVGTVDIVPTVLDLLGIDTPSEVQGRSLVPLMRGEAGEWRQYYAENLSPHLSHGWGKLRVLFDQNYKYIHGPRPELYDLSTDPAETDNLMAERPEESIRMHQELDLFLQEFASGTSVMAPADDDSVRILQSLGYLQGGAGGAGAVSEDLEEGGVAPHLHVSLINDMSAAKHLLFKRRYGDAEVFTRKLIAASPDSPSYVEMHLAALMGAGRIDDAWAYLHAPRSIAFEPSEPIVTGMALARFGQGHTHEAVELLQAHASRHCSARAHWTVAGLRARLNDEAARMSSLNDALACDEAFVQARVDIAILLAEAGEALEAEHEFRLAVSSAPFDAAARYNYGTFLLTEGRAVEAQALFERASNLAPRYWKARLGMLAAALQQGDPRKAARILEQLEREAPRSPEAIAARALMTAEDGQAAD